MKAIVPLKSGGQLEIYVGSRGLTIDRVLPADDTGDRLKREWVTFEDTDDLDAFMLAVRRGRLEIREPAGLVSPLARAELERATTDEIGSVVRSQLMPPMKNGHNKKGGAR